MEYFVETISIKTGLFGGVKIEKVNATIAEKLNELSKAGYEIVNVMPFLNDSDNFEYQIIYRK